MGVNFVKLANGETLIDLRGTTATASTILNGFMAMGADGEPIYGTAKSGATQTEKTVTLSRTGWNSDENTQTVAVAEAVEDAVIIVTGDEGEFAECEVQCIEGGTGSLTFFATFPPMANIAVNLVIVR